MNRTGYLTLRITLIAIGGLLMTSAIMGNAQSSSPNVIQGFNGNGVGAGVVGATISGGGASSNVNRVLDDFGVVSGGSDNVAGNGTGTNQDAIFATVSGGVGNIAGADRATVGGGFQNTALGIGSAIPGGRLNSAEGDYSFSAGRRAKAVHEGSFVWSDSQVIDFASTAKNQFSARVTGGARFVTGVSQTGTPTTGVVLQPGSGAWSSLSDSTVKENIQDIDPRVVLETLAQLKISEWNYSSQDDSIRHLGPMAQDFYRAFGLGADERYINSLDADGVAFVAIQALYLNYLELSRTNEQLQNENANLRNQLTEILTRLETLEKELGAEGESN